MPTAVTTSEKELRARLDLANRLGALAAGARDLAELFRALHEETARVMDATVFLFALYDETSATVQVVRQMDRGVEFPGGTFPLGKGFTSEVIRTGEPRLVRRWSAEGPADRKSTRLNSSHQIISYAVFCLKKKINKPASHYTSSSCNG